MCGNAELLRQTKNALHDAEDCIAGLERNLSAHDFVMAWLCDHREEFARLGATDTGYHVEMNGDTVTHLYGPRRRRATLPTIVELAKALGWEG